MAFHTNIEPNIFQRASSSSAITDTSTIVAPTPTSDGNGNSDSSQGLSLTGSPPLIVAFLAVGLFMAAMLTIFGWRRVVFGRPGMDSMEGDGFHTQNTEESFYGEKPELWDLWTQSPHAISSYEQLKWEHIMPFSASIKPPRGAPSDDADSRVTDTHAHLRIHSHLQNVQQHLRRHTLTAKSADNHKKDTGSAKNPSRTLQVAVAIAMPSPHQRERESVNERPASADTHVHIHHDPLDYSLGLTEMLWHSDEV